MSKESNVKNHGVPVHTRKPDSRSEYQKLRAIHGSDWYLKIRTSAEKRSGKTGPRALPEPKGN